MVEPATTVAIIGLALSLAQTGLSEASKVRGRKALAIIVNETEYNWKIIPGTCGPVNGKFEMAARDINKISDSVDQFGAKRGDKEITNYSIFALMSNGAGVQGAVAYRCDEINMDLIFYLECLAVHSNWAGVCMTPKGVLDTLREGRSYQLSKNMRKVILNRNGGWLPKYNLPGPGWVDWSRAEPRNLTYGPINLTYTAAETTEFRIKNIK
jgi:hypothetical protein